MIPDHPTARLAVALFALVLSLSVIAGAIMGMFYWLVSRSWTSVRREANQRRSWEKGWHLGQ